MREKEREREYLGEHRSKGYIAPLSQRKEARSFAQASPLRGSPAASTRELKGHEYGKDANLAGVYSGSVLHDNLHTRVSEYSVTNARARAPRGCWRESARPAQEIVSYTQETSVSVNHDPQHSFPRIRSARNLIRNSR